MTMSARVEELLKAEHVEYRTVAHRPAATSQEVARASHVPGWRLAKVVVLRVAGGGWLLAVVPAPLRVDLEALALWSGLNGLRLATEAEMVRRFRDCAPGALPPLEPLHDVPVFIDDAFAQSDDIYFDDGSQHRLVGMRVPDFVRVAHPSVYHFSSGPARAH
jgi:Ala-tRNA(Pro) deacylase